MDLKELAARLQKSQTSMLEMSRELPLRPCSPYGGLTIDARQIKEDARQAYEDIRAARIHILSIARKEKAAA